MLLIEAGVGEGMQEEGCINRQCAIGSTRAMEETDDQNPTVHRHSMN